MDNIIEPSNSFDFSRLSLAHPTGIQGGAYFTKIQYNNKPLYIQTCQSLTKQGFVKSGKKYHCDLMFDKNADVMINWFETLEETCQKLIYEKADTWFQNALEMSDVESAFNSIIRVYRSGKYYLVRTNIKNNPSNNEPLLKIYDENEIPQSMKDIQQETKIISILEIQGIKFTTRNFQIEIEMKQAMVIHDEPIFESCLIKTSKPQISISNTTQQPQPQQFTQFQNEQTTDVQQTEENIPNISTQTQILPNEKEMSENDDMFELETVDHLELFDELDSLNKENEKEENVGIGKESKTQDTDTTQEQMITQPSIKQDQNENTNANINTSIGVTKHEEKENNSRDLDIEIPIEVLDMDIEDLDETKDLNEVHLGFGSESGNNLEKMTLKKPNEVYFDLYKQARNKAKEAKKAALMAYLEAKKIKKTYMLESLNDEESDFDDEIEDVSESELEGL